MKRIAWGLAALASLLGAVGRAKADLIVSSYFTNSVLRYDTTTGAFLGTFASGGGLDGPVDQTFGPDGNFYVTSFNSRSVLSYNGLNGTFVNVFIPTGGGGSGELNGLVFGPDGDLYIGVGDRIERFDGKTGALLGTFASGGGLVEPEDLIFGRDGNLYVSDFHNNNVLRFNGTTGAFMNVFASGGGLEWSRRNGLRARREPLCQRRFQW